MRQFLITASLGLGLVLSACDDAPRRGEPYTPPSAAAQEREVLGETEPSDLPLGQRAALVYAHAMTARALAKAGDEAASDEASIIGLAGGSADAGLMTGLDTLGFDPAKLEAAMAAPDDETAAAAADEMLGGLRQGAAVDAKATIEFLMKSLSASYETAVVSGEIEDQSAYRGAYGLAVAARDIAAAQDPETFGSLKTELDVLVLMWPNKGPVYGALPAPEMVMAEQLARVKSELAGVP